MHSVRDSRLKRARVAAVAAAVNGAAGFALAQLSITTYTGPYSVNFDTIVADVSNGIWAGTGFQTNPGGGQLDSDAWAVTGWSNGNLAFGGAQQTANTDYTRGSANASVETGGMYAFSGGNITTGRALGIQPGTSDWAPGTLTLRIRNNGSSTISAFDISYLVYVRNDQGRASSFNFAYSANNTSYTAVPSLDLTSGEAAVAGGFVSNSRSTTLSGLSVAPGDFFYVRWLGADVSGSGSRDEFALDSIQFSNFAVLASSLYWDLNGATAGIGGGGPATWDTTSSNWNVNSAGTNAPTTWTSASPAIFGGTAGQVDIVAGGVTANGGIQFDSDGYVVSGGTLTVGTTPTITVSTAAYTATVSARVSGSNGLTKAGPGTLVLGNNLNDFTGNVTISAGTLSISAEGNLGNTTNDIILSGGALKATSSINLDSGRDISGAGGTIDVGTGLVVSGDGAVNLTGALTLSGAGQVTMAGVGKSIAGLNFSDAGRLDLTAAGATIGGNVTTTNTTGTAELDGVFSVGSSARNYTVGDGSAAIDFYVPASISGSGRINKLGSGAMQLDGDNSAFSGGFRIGGTGEVPPDGGELIVTNKNALGTGQLQMNNGTLSASTSLTGTDALPASLSVGAPSTVNAGQGAVLNGDMEFTGSFSLFKTTGAPEYVLTVNNTTTLSGNVTASSGSTTPAGFTKGGHGTLILSGATNAMAETVTISAGTLQIGTGGATGVLGSGNVVNDSRLAFNRTGSLLVSNDISGSGNVHHNGTGVTTMQGALSYSGTTHINAGTVRHNGTHTGGGACTVANGGTLGGSGSTASPIVVQSGGTLAPGNSIGELTAGAMNLNAGAKYLIELNTTVGNEATDRMVLTGTSQVQLGDGVNFPTLQLSFVAPVVEQYVSGKAFVIVQNTQSGAIIDPSSQFAGPAPVDGVQTIVDGLVQYAIYYGTFTGTIYGGGVNADGNDIVIEFTSVPEPSMLSLATGALLFGRRNRRR